MAFMSDATPPEWGGLHKNCANNAKFCACCLSDAALIHYPGSHNAQFMMVIPEQVNPPVVFLFTRFRLFLLEARRPNQGVALRAWVWAWG